MFLGQHEIFEAVSFQKPIVEIVFNIKEGKMILKFAKIQMRNSKNYFNTYYIATKKNMQMGLPSSDTHFRKAAKKRV